MNFSKVFLFIFSLATMITLILILANVKEASSGVYYTFVACSILHFLVNTYVTYSVSFDVQETKS